MKKIFEKENLFLVTTKICDFLLYTILFLLFFGLFLVLSSKCFGQGHSFHSSGPRCGWKWLYSTDKVFLIDPNDKIGTTSGNLFFDDDLYLNLSSSFWSNDTGINFREGGSLRYSIFLYGASTYNNIVIQTDADEDGTLDTTALMIREDGKVEFQNPVAISNSNSSEDSIGLLVGRVGTSLNAVFKMLADELDNGEIIFAEEGSSGDRFKIQFDSYTGYSPNSAGIRFYSDNEDTLADTTYQLGVLSTNGRLGLGDLPFDTSFPATKLHLYQWDSNPDSVYDAIYVDHNCTSPTDGIGSAIVLRAKDESGNMDEAGRLQGLHTDATHASQESRVDITAGGAAAGTGLSILSNGNHGVNLINPIASLDVDGTINQRYYYWVEEFWDEANDVEFESGLVADFWTTAGTNYVSSNVFYSGMVNGACGTIKMVTTGADNDSDTTIGLPLFYTNKGLILETRFSFGSDISNVYIAVGFAEGAYADKTTHNDDIFVVGVDTDNGHGFGANHIVAISNDNNGGVIYMDCTTTISTLTWYTIRIDISDTEQPRVWLNNSEISPTAITGTVQANILVSPYIMIQSLETDSDHFYIDYIKVWQSQ